MHANIPQDGFESIQYSKPWSWSIGEWLISSGFIAAIITSHFAAYDYCFTFQNTLAWRNVVFRKISGVRIEQEKMYFVSSHYSNT